MNRSQLTKLAAFYGCHIDRTFSGNVGTIHTIHIKSPDYGSEETIREDDLGYKKAQDIVPILEQLSGLKTADLWKAGKS